MADQQKYVPDPPPPPPYPFTYAEGTGADSMLAPPPYSHNSGCSLAGPPRPPGNSAPKSGRGLSYNQNPVPALVSYTSSSGSVILQQPQAPPPQPEQPARWNGKDICTCNSMPPACLAIGIHIKSTRKYIFYLFCSL